MSKKSNVVSFDAARKKRRGFSTTRRGFAFIPWDERGTPKLTPELMAYALARVSRSYVKRMKLRALPEGLLILYWNLDGTPKKDFARIRLLPAADRRKFSQERGSGNHFYFAPLTDGQWADTCGDTDKRTYLVEKEFGAAALAQHGLAAIGIGGVWNWLQRDAQGESAPIPDFDLIKWRKRKVVLVFDADVCTKESVQVALIRLMAELRRRGARVRFKLIPDLGDGRSGADDYIVAKGIKKFLKLPNRTLDEPEFESWGLAKEPKCTDTGNGMRFVLHHADRVRYAHEWRSFLLWDSVRWQRDATEAVWDAARQTVRGIYREAHEHPDAERRAEIAEWATESEGASRLSNMLRLARTERAIGISANQLDSHPLLLTVTNGVVDLRTGELLPTDPQYLLTKQCPIAFDAEATCPVTEQFISEIMGGDDELVSYLQRVIGYLLTGDTREQCFFVFYGIGANGKSTLLRLLVDLLGDFATSTRMETWSAQKRNAGGPSEDVARLHGARMVSAVESEDDQRLAESLVKELTGQDRVNARRLYENSFEYIPQFKLILVCNHKPAIRGDDPAIWRRVRLVPFEQVFPPSRQDRQLSAKLKEELPGILNWAIRGCLDWQKSGLAEPEKILAATAQYRSDNDLLQLFLTDCCSKGKEHTERASTLYARYTAWTSENGHKPLSATKFGNRLLDRGFRRHRNKRGMQYVGLKVRRSR